MAAMKLIVLAATCVCAFSFPQTPTLPLTRNTIFADEKLEGNIFENLEQFDIISQARNNDNSSLYRLPTTTKPRHYNVLWAIDISRLAFTGTVDIELVATEPNVDQIIIHCSEMDIYSTSLRLNNQVVEISDPVYDDVTQFMYIRLNSSSHATLQYNGVTDVVYTLSISFAAPLRTNMYGIYRSWYRNNATTESSVTWMATTQFQATAARWAFPCYDEPAFKATFSITIRRPTAYNSWSCTKIANTITSVQSGYEDDIYSMTPIMSTYLLAIIVAQYESKSYPENGPLVYEVIARPGAMQDDQGDYAFNVGMDLLDMMSYHTGIDFYSVSENLKMTQASIPDFGAGAMENWGLLTYREAYLMYKEGHTNKYFKQLIAYILSHEIAHMWFGNLVTNDWWDVLWLNEGFARYYQYFLTHWVETDMGFEERFVIEQVHTALLSDSSNSPHPLSTTSIGNRASVSGMFSTISYNKGAAIIRMTEYLLGHEVHREGLSNYLKANYLGTVLPIDLFNALQNVSVVHGAISEYGPDFNVIDYYKSWTEQPGHPVLNVQVNHQTGEMTIYQRRFNINTGYSLTPTNYIVPITFATASNPDFNSTKPTHILRRSVTTIQRGSVGDEWVILNNQQIGYYRVNYDDYTWDLIIRALRSENRTQIHKYNRAQIVNDVFQFARSGLMTYTRAFNILSFLENETEYAPWVAAITGFTWLRNRLATTPYLPRLQSMIAAWTNTAISRLTYSPPAEGEEWMETYLRYQLAPQVCLANVTACHEAATTQFRALVDNGIEVPVDNRNWVYCNALRYGTQQDFTYLWERFLEHNVYTEKIQLLMVLGCTPYNTTLNTFLDGIVQNNYIIRPQDYTTALNSAVSGNEENTQIVFKYIQDNLESVRIAFNGTSTPLSYISSRLRSVSEVAEFQQWVNENRAELGDEYATVYAGSVSAQASIAWAAEVQNDLLNFFNNGASDVELSTTAPIVVPPVVTVTPGSLVQPATPALPDRDAAATTYLSIILIAFAIITNILI